MRNVCWVLMLLVMSLGRFARAELNFGPRQKVPVVNSPSQDELGVSVFTLSDDQTEGMLIGRTPRVSFHSFLQSSRAAPDGDWSSPVKLDSLSDKPGYFARVTLDGLTVLQQDGWWFASPPHLAGGFGGGDIWMARRETAGDDFGALENLGGTINSQYYDGGGMLSADGLTLFFDSRRPGGTGLTDLWMASRDGPDVPWNDPVNLGDALNSRAEDVQPAISPDGLQLFFSSDRLGTFDIWMSTRDTTSDPWSDPVRLDGNVNQYSELGPALSPDGSTLYFSANLTAGLFDSQMDIYEASVLSVPEPAILSGDYNGNGTVEQADLDLVLLNWGNATPPVPAGWDDDLPSGTIDQEELDKVLLNWGNAVASASAAAVPEPSTLSIALVVISLAYCVCRPSGPHRVRRHARGAGPA